MQVFSCSHRLLIKPCSKEQKATVVHSTDIRNNTIKTVVDYQITATKDWTELTQNSPLFLQPKYLKAIEACPPKDMQFAYLTFYKNDLPCGVAYAQIFKFSTYESLKHHRSFNDGKDGFLPMKKWIARQIEFYSIVCGNVLMTGEYGFHFDEKVIPQQEQFEIVNQGLDELKGALNQKGIKPKVTLFKDFKSENRQNIEVNQFGEFKIQPNMIIDIAEDWQKFEDYLAAMSAKYRTRAKRAFKKGKVISKRELDLSEVEFNEAKIFELYESIAVSAGFNGIKLPQNYFTNLKRELGDIFKVIGYYKEEKLIGFYTVFLEEKYIESHYLGIDQNENREHQVYLNMLYDMVKIGIYHQVKRIFLARTALEIKSSVGATPHDLYFYMKHDNELLNPFVKRAFDIFNPKEEWTQRRPFKSSK